MTVVKENIISMKLIIYGNCYSEECIRFVTMSKLMMWHLLQRRPHCTDFEEKAIYGAKTQTASN